MVLGLETAKEDEMTDPIAFPATYVTFRHVQGRKTVQFVFEVPVEKFKAASDILGGAPNIDQSVWVAIARLNQSSGSPPKDLSKADVANIIDVDIARQEKISTSLLKPHKRRHELPVGSQAALACQDAAFQAWMDATGEDETADALRVRFKVKSRADIPTDDWAYFYADFEQWAGRAPEPR